MHISNSNFVTSKDIELLLNFVTMGGHGIVHVYVGELCVVAEGGPDL